MDTVGLSIKGSPKNPKRKGEIKIRQEKISEGQRVRQKEISKGF